MSKKNTSSCRRRGTLRRGNSAGGGLGEKCEGAMFAPTRILTRLTGRVQLRRSRSQRAGAFEFPEFYAMSRTCVKDYLGPTRFFLLYGDYLTIGRVASTARDESDESGRLPSIKW